MVDTTELRRLHAESTPGYWKDFGFHCFSGLSLESSVLEAPKDGTPIDLWVTFPTRPEIQPQRYTDCFWEKELNRWNCVHGYDACFVPTHYRELPAPPEGR